jgi:catechol 2,3-dioxygenase-like lactoylglutathione lyase family enzyme
MMRFERLIAIRLVSHDAAALASFYSAALGFERGATVPIAAEELAMLGLAGTGSRTALTLGGQVLELDQFDPPGQPYPQPRASDDRFFQHFAMVTGDMAGAWARVLAAGGLAVSTDGPVQLPPENGGVRAVKFRDPEGHPLELLAFPEPEAAKHSFAIDHSAIVVRDVAASIAFYQARGLAMGERTLNHGPAQAALDGLPLAAKMFPQRTPSPGLRRDRLSLREPPPPEGEDLGHDAQLCVDVVPLNPPGAGPHLELLGYRDLAPRMPIEWNPRDVAATRLVWEASGSALVTDPDGHLHQCWPAGALSKI